MTQKSRGFAPSIGAVLVVGLSGGTQADEAVQTEGVGVGDIDLDGDLDVVGTAQTSAILSWWEATEFDSSGELESSIYDSGIGASMGSIDWTGMEPPGTSLRFQVRSSNDPGDLGIWSGDITSPTDFPDPLDRYFQYRVLLETTDPDKSPVLHDVTFGPALAGFYR